VRVGEKQYPESLHAGMIAPCGMDCGLCLGHLRDKNRCDGCFGDDASKPKHCVVCRIRNCDEIDAGKGELCSKCTRFPCTRLKQLDKRYRLKYGMSMIANLETIREVGLEDFVASERQRWKCPGCGGVVCVHSESCVYCGQARG
jgi:hypothetical protein